MNELINRTLVAAVWIFLGAGFIYVIGEWPLVVLTLTIAPLIAWYILYQRYIEKYPLDEDNPWRQHE